ncbi:hypothetical protein AB4Z54_63720, partial [Streptomyces sp. MCAF7]
MDQDVVRRVLAAAAAWWDARPQGGRVDTPWDFVDFVDLPVVRLGAQWVRGGAARFEAATALNLSTSGPLGEAQRLRMLWAWVRTMD